jgi:hypothetical protein
VGRFALQGRSMMGASRGSGSLRRCGWIADVGDTARRRRMRRPGSLAGLAPAPQWLWVESVALVIAVEEAQQVQDTLFKKLWRGFAPSFSAHVRFGEGHPSSSLRVCFGIEGLESRAAVSHISRKTSEMWGTRLWWQVKDSCGLVFGRGFGVECAAHPGLLVSERSYRQQDPGGRGQVIEQHSLRQRNGGQQ